MAIDGYVGRFTSTDGATLTSSKDWEIHLNQTKLMSADNTQHRVMQSAQGTGYGSTTVYYSKAKDAALDMGANVPEGKYSATITWTLNATPDVSVN
ncbi:WxL domain-containing protein [Weissella cibaria]|uniref:WxL domain-containing protein n=1 Tax=Weissella cibaria TaxID=137591 RepID=UPI00106DE2A6|nr:WxL domain-containing protein [Weissella cibaria]